MSAIEWTDVTWNPVVGCTRVSAGCQHCYAERMARRLDGRGIGYDGTTREGARWSGQVNMLARRLAEPLRWRKPRRVFVCSMSDLFHEDVPFTYIASVFGVMAATPAQTYQVLTKRPERMAEFFSWVERHKEPSDYLVQSAAYRAGAPIPLHRVKGTVLSRPWPLLNVWLGVSCEDQDTFDERAWRLARVPASVRFLSLEPLLGPISWRCRTVSIPWAGGAAGGGRDYSPLMDFIHWVIVGGESGPGSRPMDIAWARSIVEQCREGNVACFMKQLGATPFERDLSSWPNGHPHGDRTVTFPGDGFGRYYATGLRDPKGGDPSEWPGDLRVREFPPHV